MTETRDFDIVNDEEIIDEGARSVKDGQEVKILVVE